MPSPRNSDVTSCEQHCEIRYEFRITKVPDVVLSVVRITRRILTVSTEARRDATPVPALPRTQHYHAPRMSWRAPASRVCGVAGATPQALRQGVQASLVPLVSPSPRDVSPSTSRRISASAHCLRGVGNAYVVHRRASRNSR